MVKSVYLNFAEVGRYLFPITSKPFQMYSRTVASHACYCYTLGKKDDEIIS